MNRNVVPLVGLLLLASCTTPTGTVGQTAERAARTPTGTVGPTREQAAQNRARPYVEGMEALERYRASASPEDRREVLAKIAELEDDARSFGRLSSYFPAYARQARGRHTSLAFDFADEALKHGDLDASDRVYRRLIEFYVGNAYSGIRDRARLGVEDVRAAASPTK